MDPDLEAIRALLIELASSSGRGDGRRIRELQEALQRLLQSQGLADCGAVHVYGRTSMDHTSDLVGHAFLMDLELAVPVRLSPPGPTGPGAVRCGHPSTAQPPTELERAWREDTFPSSPAAYGAAWPFTGGAPSTGHAAPGGSAGDGSELIRSLGALSTAGAASAVRLSAIWDTIAAMPGLRQQVLDAHAQLNGTQVDGITRALRDVLAAVQAPAAGQGRTPGAGAAWAPAPEAEADPWGAGGTSAGFERGGRSGSGRGPAIRPDATRGAPGVGSGRSQQPADTDAHLPPVLRAWRPPK